MEREEPSNNKNKGKEQVVEEDQAKPGDDNNTNPINIVDTSSTSLGLGLVLAPQGASGEGGLGIAEDVIRRTRGLGADGSSTGRRRMHKCKYCEKEFSTSQALGGHQNAHKPERVAAKFQESLGKMGAMGREHMNMSRYQPYQPYYFNPALNIRGPASGLNLGGLPPTRQHHMFQSPDHSSFLSPGLGSGNRFPAPGQVHQPVPRQGGNESGSQGLSQRIRSWSEFLIRPNDNNNATSGASSNLLTDGSGGVGRGRADSRILRYYPGGIGFGPQSMIGNNPNANMNRNLNLFGHNLHPNANAIGNVHPNVNPTGNANPDNNVGAIVGAVAAAPPADDRGEEEEDENGGEDGFDLTLRL